MRTSALHPSPVIMRRLLLLAATLTIGFLIWHLLGDSAGVVAVGLAGDESAGQGPPTPGAVLAHVDGVAITDREVESRVAEELADLDARRDQLMAEALESQINEHLLEAEAVSLSLDREQLLKIEVEEKLDEVEDRAVEALYASQVFSEPLPAIETRLRRQLRLQAYYAELRRRAAVDVYRTPS
ncbi:MAG: hypothetical protein AAF725_01875 [Acidobacteriota bacterium]